MRLQLIDFCPQKTSIVASLSEPHVDRKAFPRDLCMYESMYVFCANRGSGPSMDCLAQTVDRAFERTNRGSLTQSVDRVGLTVDSYC